MSLVLNVEILGQYKKLTKATDGAAKTIKGLQDKFAKAGKAIAATTGAIGLGIGAAVASQIKPAIQAASNLQESLNAVNVAFGENAEGIKAIGEGAAKNLGLSQKSFNDLAVRFSAFAKTIAGDGGDVVGTIESIAQRGADFASVFNLDVNEALTKFQSGLSGETEPLRAFGIDVSAAKVEQYALAKGLIKSKDELTEQVKVMARYGTIMEQTNMVQGDFTNTSDGLANSNRIVQASIEDLQAKIGTALLPVLENLVNWVRDDVLPALEDLWADLKDPTTIVGESWADLSDAWNDFVEVFKGGSQDVQAENVFAWILDSMTSIMRMGTHFATFWKEVFEGVALLFQSGLSFGPLANAMRQKGIAKIFGALNEANMAVGDAPWDTKHQPNTSGISVPSYSLPRGASTMTRQEINININRANLVPSDVVKALQQANVTGITVR